MSTSSKKITLKTNDEKTFEVDESVALQSQTLKYIIEDAQIDDGILIPDVTGNTLSKVIEYCEKHAKDLSEEELKNWDEDFMRVDSDTLYHLMCAANVLEVKNLLDLTCQTVANMIKGRSPNEIRELLNIKNDFTPEEDKRIREENQWAF